MGVRMYRRAMALVSVALLACGLRVAAADAVRGSVIKHEMAGNWEVRLRVPACGKAGTVKVFFAAREDLRKRVCLEISAKALRAVREMPDGTRTVLRTYPGPGPAPWDVRLLKKGMYYRYWINGKPPALGKRDDFNPYGHAGYLPAPGGYWMGRAHYEQPKAFLGVEYPAGAKPETLTVESLPWLPDVEAPLIRTVGDRSKWYSAQLLPGGIVKVKNTWYMYVTGANPTIEGKVIEGVGRRQIGVAYSKDLKTWTMHPELLIRTGGKGSWEELGIYCSGAVVTPEGKIAVMYAAQRGKVGLPQWGGFGVAFADHPLGPFTKHAGNPVYKHVSHAHEFDLVRVDGPAYRYMLLYAGFTVKAARGPDGDRGYLITSNDLVKWTPANGGKAVFQPETLAGWDACHVRPRSLTRLDGTWYLFYEGCNNFKYLPDVKGQPDGYGQWRFGWWDGTGLARSKDLRKWEYYPRNPALFSAGTVRENGDHDGRIWIGWPRAVVDGDLLRVFYAGGTGIYCRTIPLKMLKDWRSEGGKTIKLGGGR